MHAIYADLAPWIATYGSALVFVVVMLEAFGVPLPGETALVSAALYAVSTHRIDIFTLLISAAAGATIGGMIGYWIGRTAGHAVLLKYGARIGLSERRLVAGEYLFAHHGGKIVFFGRFFAILRAAAALLAGANIMRWRHFLATQILASIVWSIVYGGGAYVFGKEITHLSGPISTVIVGIGILTGIGIVLFAHRQGRRIERVAAIRARRPRP